MDDATSRADGHACPHELVDRVMKRSGDRGLPHPDRTWNTRDRSTGPSPIPHHDGTPAGYGTGPRDRPRALDD
ncbi:hypothetical protein [Streptomyces sp. NPDC003522]